MSNNVYSVWNWDKGVYDYYRSRRHRAYRERVGYPSSSNVKGVGDIPEESVHPLPSSSVYVGSGSEAIGVISSSSKRHGILFVAATLLGLWFLK